MNNFKKSQLEKKIHVLVSEIIDTSVKNENAKLAIIHSIHLSPDNSWVRIYVSFLDNEEESLKELQNASGFIRTQLAQTYPARQTPKIIFELDSLLDSINSIEEKLDKLKK